MRALTTALFALSLLAGPSPAQIPDLGQGLGTGDKVTVDAKLVPAKARPGETVTVELKVSIEPGWHIYGVNEEVGTKTTVTLDEASDLQPLGKAEVPGGEPHPDGLGGTSWWIAGQTTLRQRVVVAKGLQPGTVELKGVLGYMACTEESCDPPAEVDWSAKLVIEEGEPRQDFVFKKVSVDARFAGPVRAGETARLELKTKIMPPWHIYGGKEEHNYKTRVTITEAGGLTPGKTIIPDGEPHDDGLGGKTWWLKGEPTIVQELAVPKGAEPGKLKVRGSLGYMPCTEVLCDDATEVPFETELTIEEGEARATPVGGGKAQSGARVTAQNELEKASFWQFILAAIGGALFALVMPCTYPMIPITISYFTKQAENRDGKVVPLALTYGAGIILIFAAIGAFFAPWIDLVAFHWATNLVVTLLFFVFGLSLIGLFTLQPPKFLMNYAGKASMRGGYAGVFLMGLTLVVTSFTCTAPFVGSVIALGAKQGAVITALGMGVFGLTMAIPFVLLSLMPGKLQSLPSSGSWMNTLKVTLGFVEIAAALKFLSNVDLALNWQWLSRELFLVLWAGIFLVTTLFLLGLIRMKGETGEVGPGRVTAALFFVFLAGYSIYGAMGNRTDSLIMAAMEPPYSNRLLGPVGGTTDSDSQANGNDGKGSVGHTIVEDDYDEALRLAKLRGKRLFVNFTGDR